jgi:hypothetical protein
MILPLIAGLGVGALSPHTKTPDALARVTVSGFMTICLSSGQGFSSKK